MALINSINNTASISYDGSDINSNTTATILLLPPTILKSVDKLIASIGDTLTYTVTITNVALSPITNLPFSDIIPPGAEYIDDSFQLNGSAATPILTDDTLTFTIPNIGILGVAIITFQVTIIGGEE